MDFEPQASLQPYNSLHFPATARYLCRARSEEDLRAALERARRDELRLFILGGGSNVIIPNEVDGLVLRMETRGVEVLEETTRHALLRVAAGEDWPELVRECLRRGYYGLENLSDIPGTAGAAPIQNIGAYGVELSEQLQSVEVLELQSGRASELKAADCGLAYRQSRFKGDWRGRYLILGIRLQLDKEPHPRLDYTGIVDELRAMGCGTPKPPDVARAVSSLRARKLTDPEQVGNVGSFFTNPTVSPAEAQALAEEHPDLPRYPQAGGGVKLAAGWLVERCGFKGLRRGAVGVSQRQALVLLHYGGGQASDLLDLAADIQDAVRQRFGISLQREPRILGERTREDPWYAPA